jgi:hypothetical protein
VRGHDDELVEMFQAYYDASGQESHGLVSVAGWLSTARRWADFQPKWNGALNEARIPYFHMSALKSGRGPFAELSRDKQRRDQLIETLATIVRETVLFGVSSTMYHDDFVAADKMFGLAARYRNAFVLAARDCMKRVDAYTARLQVPSRSAVAHIFEWGDDGLGRLAQICRDMGEAVPAFHPSAPNVRGIPHLVQLQSTDWAAHQCFKLGQRYKALKFRPVPHKDLPSPVALLDEVPKDWLVYDVYSMSTRALALLDGRLALFDSNRRN